jgi:hypothetical protein
MQKSPAVIALSLLLASLVGCGGATANGPNSAAAPPSSMAAAAEARAATENPCSKAPLASGAAQAIVNASHRSRGDREDFVCLKVDRDKVNRAVSQASDRFVLAFVKP